MYLYKQKQTGRSVGGCLVAKNIMTNLFFYLLLFVYLLTTTTYYTVFVRC